MGKLRWIGPGVMIVGLTWGLAACGDGEPRTREQVWIDMHPTHAGVNGECVEFDGELCDADPFDLDDLGGGGVKSSPKVPKPASVKPSPRPVRTLFQPAPKTTRRR